MFLINCYGTWLQILLKTFVGMSKKRILIYLLISNIYLKSLKHKIEDFIYIADQKNC